MYKLLGNNSCATSLRQAVLGAKSAAAGYPATKDLVMRIPKRKLEQVTNKQHVSIQSIVMSIMSYIFNCRKAKIQP
jgi:TATA-box binding protein (TBP) (component of TFIID and TFIIIB)